MVMMMIYLEPTMTEHIFSESLMFVDLNQINNQRNQIHIHMKREKEKKHPLQRQNIRFVSEEW
jgi:hypothetical protein